VELGGRVEAAARVVLCAFCVGHGTSSVGCFTSDKEPYASLTYVRNYSVIKPL
jgi:hypothetical protein